ncbi:hypothetical protein [Pseudoclavibacter helvolus]|uniref:hypothetical protein n=1 Tax=Pseudoclavibacter helvolus TaxID=255205 RepID=UPI003C7098B1
MWRRLWRASVWHPDALPIEEFKFRSLKRVWLPLYDAAAFGAGLWAIVFGSPILHRLFHPDVIDLLGALLAVAAAVCFAGVAFPSLWRVEIAGKLVLLMLLAAYALTIIAFRTNPQPEALFVVFILVLGMPLPFFRLSLLGEEIKERRDEESA